MLHGYCIRSAGDPGPEPDLTGVGGQAVTRVDGGGLQIWLSPAADSAVTVERLREHERVVRAALQTATPLPLRYGTRFGSEAEAEAAMLERNQEFVAALERLRDHVEMSVRVSLAAPPDGGHPAQGGRASGPGPGSPGRAFLARRKMELQVVAEERARADQILSEVEDELGNASLPTVRTPAPAGGSVGSLAHLVHRRRLRAYRESIEELRRKRGDLHIDLSGPWAPYSFV